MKHLEAVIEINGHRLTEGESMTVRVALSSMAMELEDGLGDDENGKAITAGYRSAIASILRKMAK
jgi:hypothetical protein